MIRIPPGVCRAAGLSALIFAVAAGFCLAPPTAHGQSAGVSHLLGAAVDDADASLNGQWTPSTSTRPFVGKGYQHDGNTDKVQKSATFLIGLPADGEYHVLLGYTPGSNRAGEVPVEVHSVDGVKRVTVDQRKKPALAPGFTDLGAFKFTQDQGATVVVMNEGTKGM